MLDDFNPLHHSILFSSPRRLTLHCGWQEHIPFAMLLVDLLKPELIVELGTQDGDSYCAFCQAVQELQLKTGCYAINHWDGDGVGVLANLRAYHDPLYGKFSRLIQNTFDSALAQFSDGTIDLLHIDGHRTYEEVKHDFESWLPKMSVQGVMLFHGVNVREDDITIWKFWQEVRQQFPHFEFVHAHGLGMLVVGREPPLALEPFLQFVTHNAFRARHYFFFLGTRVSMRSEHLGLLRAERQRSEQDAGKSQAVIQYQQQSLHEREEKLLEMIADRDRLAQQMADAQARIKSQQDTLADKTAHVNRLVASQNQLVQELGKLQAVVESQQRTLGQKMEKSVTTEREQLVQELAQFRATLHAREQTLREIDESLAWLLVLKLRRAKDKFFPTGTRRRQGYETIKKAVEGAMKLEFF